MPFLSNWPLLKRLSMTPFRGSLELTDSSFGDVEFGLAKIEELPDASGLVRQAFEKQMGNEDGS
jgi:hypothetical protein